MGRAPRPSDIFNLRMLALGMTAPCLNAGNLPKPADLAKAAAAVQAARKRKLGFWKEADRILHGYEFRALGRLGTGQGGLRYLLPCGARPESLRLRVRGGIPDSLRSPG